jgi:hypothetical protein
MYIALGKEEAGEMIGIISQILETTCKGNDRKE